MAMFSQPAAAQDTQPTPPTDTAPTNTNSMTPPSQDPPTTPPGPKSSTIDSPEPKVGTSNPDDLKQTKRILGIIPNYRAVSANTPLPPITVKEKFWLATQDSFDYSNFIFVGILSGISMAGKSEPSFNQGAAGYGRYYWHTFVDVGVGNYMTEAIVPVITREDPRYYTLGHGGFVKRTGYSLSRLFITRANYGEMHNTFNFSELVGNGAAAGISNTYYPKNTNAFVKTYQRWGTQIAFDGFGNFLKEFWPEINRTVFHNKY